jgi:hypothetical protein
MKLRLCKRSLTSLILLGIFVLLAGCNYSSRKAAREAANLPPDNLVPVDVSPEEFIVSKRVYVPVYSSIFWRYAHATELVAAMSVRNIDPEDAIFLTGVSYYDSDGAVIRTYLDQTYQLGPMATAAFTIPRDDESGGFGANFMVEWGATGLVSDPIVETVMFGQAGSAGISFTSRGKVIDETRRVTSPTLQD